MNIESSPLWGFSMTNDLSGSMFIRNVADGEFLAVKSQDGVNEAVASNFKKFIFLYRFLKFICHSF